MQTQMAASSSVSIALAGSGGSGVMTAGTMLLAAAAKAGAYGLMVRTSGPQIRGGEAAAMLRLGAQPLNSLDDGFDLLLAIDWQNVNRFADEIVLGPRSVLIGDPDEGEAPEVFKATGARYAPLGLKKMAKAIPGSWASVVTWTPDPEAPYYCVEPWMGPPNSPEHKNGLRFAEPGQVDTFVTEVSLM